MFCPDVEVGNAEAFQDFKRERVFEFHSQQDFNKAKTSLMELNTKLGSFNLCTLAVGVYCKIRAAPIHINGTRVELLWRYFNMINF